MTDMHTNVACNRNSNSPRKATAMDNFSDTKMDRKFSKNLEEASICFLELNKVPFLHNDALKKINFTILTLF